MQIPTRGMLVLAAACLVLAVAVSVSQLAKAQLLEDYYCDMQPQSEASAHECYCEGQGGNPNQKFQCQVVMNGEPYEVFVECTDSPSDNCFKWWDSCGFKFLCEPHCSNLGNCVQQQISCATTWQRCRDHE